MTPIRPWPAAPLTLALGLTIRATSDGDFAKYAGVALYTLFLYTLILLLTPRTRPLLAATLALTLSWAVELFQLTPIPATLSAQSTLAHLILGSTFNPPDLFWYGVGAALGLLTIRAKQSPEDT